MPDVEAVTSRRDSGERRWRAQCGVVVGAALSSLPLTGARERSAIALAGAKAPPIRAAGGPMHAPPSGIDRKLAIGTIRDESSRMTTTYTLHRLIHGLVAGMLLWGSLSAAAQDDTLAAIRALVEKSDYAEASRRIESYLSANPSDPQGRFLKGIVLAEQEQSDAAIEVFSALARDYPSLPEPHNNLAVLYAAQGDYVRARDELLIAINTHPSYATAHENLGDIYAKMAGLAYDKALELDNQNESAKAKLALMHDLVSVPSRVPVEVEVAAATSLDTTVAPVVMVEPARREKAQELQTEILQTLMGWAGAWSSQDVDRYLSFYASDYSPPGMSRSAWQGLRRKRLKSPAYIKVDIRDPEVDLEREGRVRVSFTQGYESDTFSDRVRKTLRLSMDRGRWVIVSENTNE